MTLAVITLAFNCGKSRATNFSPYYLLLLRSPRMEIDILDNNRTPGQEEDEYINESQEKLKKVFIIIEKEVKKNLDNRIKEDTLINPIRKLDKMFLLSILPESW